MLELPSEVVLAYGQCYVTSEMNLPSPWMCCSVRSLSISAALDADGRCVVPQQEIIVELVPLKDQLVSGKGQQHSHTILV